MGIRIEYATKTMSLVQVQRSPFYTPGSSDQGYAGLGISACLLASQFVQTFVLKRYPALNL